MARGIDLSGLTPAERLVAVSGAVLFLDGFVPWWYRIRTARQTYLHNAGLTGWGLLAVMLGFAAVAVVVVRSASRARTRADHLVYIGLGAAALAALGIEARSSGVEWIGYWVAEAASILLLAGGARRRREHKTGWI